MMVGTRSGVSQPRLRDDAPPELAGIVIEIRLLRRQTTGGNGAQQVTITRHLRVATEKLLK